MISLGVPWVNCLECSAGAFIMARSMRRTSTFPKLERRRLRLQRRKCRAAEDIRRPGLILMVPWPGLRGILLVSSQTLSLQTRARRASAQAHTSHRIATRRCAARRRHRSAQHTHALRARSAAHLQQAVGRATLGHRSAMPCQEGPSETSHSCVCCAVDSTWRQCPAARQDSGRCKGR